MVMRDASSRLRARIVFGLFIVAVGVFALLDNLHLFDSERVQPYWPLVFVALGALRLAHRRGNGIVWSLGLMAVGTAMTLNNLGIIHFQWREWWPAVLIVLGLSVMLRGSGPHRHKHWRFVHRHRHGGPPAERDEHSARIDAEAIMSGLVLRNDSQEFQGGEISTVMGSVELDLRQASMPPGEARLRVEVVMGSVEIRVPRDWSVAVRGTPVLGGIQDRTVPPVAPSRRLVIDAAVVMGGVEIDN